MSEDLPYGSASAGWVRAPEARQKILDATIEMLREHAFADVTTAMIAERSGTNRPSINRNFGTREQLFDCVTKELSNRFAERAEDSAPTQILSDPDIVLRTRLIAWLLGEGLAPDDLAVRSTSRAGEATLRRQRRHGVGEETARIFNQMMVLLAEGFIVFWDTHVDFSDEDLIRGIELLGAIQRQLPHLEELLGWTAPGG